MKTDINVLRKTTVYAEEAFVVDIQSFLESVMHSKGMTRAKLAEAMGVSRARVSQMFSSEANNFTVRLLARALHAMGERGEMTCEMHRKIKRRSQFADLIVDAPRFETDWSAGWEHATRAANDHGPELNQAIEIADSDHELVEVRVAQSLRRATARQWAVA